jgi:hypothetical protein
MAGCGSSKKTAEVTITSGTTTSVSKVSVGGSSGDCKSVADLGKKLSQSLSAASAGNGGDIGAQAQATAKAFKQFADQAPSSVKDDFETFATAFQHYADAIKGVHFKQGQVPSSGDLNKLTSAAQELTKPDLQKAEQHLLAWGRKNCKGVNFGTTTP